MKKIAAVGLLGCALIATGVAGASTGRSGSGTRAAAATPIVWGVADDGGKYADDGGAWFNSELQGAHLGEERWTLQYSGSPTTIAEKAFLDRAAPQAQRDGIKVELSLYGTPDAGNSDPEGFCSWAAFVALYVQQWNIQDLIIWNEPNTGLYWKGAGSDATVPAKYEALLASCYDKIKVANPNAVVIGFGLSPRKGTPTQTAPIPFIKAVGAAYVASGRDRPIMDMISVHPYPNPNNPTDGPDVGYADTNNYGIPNLDRVKQAVYDAFNGTKQKTTVNGLQIVLDEVGWQTDTKKYGQYIHNDNVKTVDEPTQTQYLKTATEKYFACDPTIATVNWFLLVDESTRDGKDASGNTVGGGWQSGLLTAGGKGVSAAKQAYTALASDWAAGRSACTGQPINWTPKTSGGSGSGGGGGATAANGDADLAAVTDIIGSDALAKVIRIIGLNNAKTIFGTATASELFSFADTGLRQILALFDPQTGYMVSGGYFWSGTTATTLTVRHTFDFSNSLRSLDHATAGIKVLAKGMSSGAAGQPMKLKTKRVFSGKLGPGYVYVAVVIRSKADPSKTGVVLKKIATITAKAKPNVKPKKKK